MSEIQVYLLTPTRRRPDMLGRSIESAKSTARRPDRVVPLLAVDEDDATNYARWPHVLRGTRWGYRWLHHYYNCLSRLACALDADGPPGWQVLWNDDETMLTQDWDERLVSYPSLPHVRFLRRDCTMPHDTAYPAWPRSYVELTKRVSNASCCDTWLSIAAAMADWVLGRNAVHLYAHDVVLHHARLDEVDKARFAAEQADQPTQMAPAPPGFPDDDLIERDTLLLASAHGFEEWRRPGWIPSVSGIIAPHGTSFEIHPDRWASAVRVLLDAGT